MKTAHTLAYRVFITLLSLCVCAFAETPTTDAPVFLPDNLHQWGAVTLFHGLPSDRVNAIAQGPDGVMWFGTDAGLARFDGRRVQTLNTPQLPVGRVRALQFDAAGSLWIGTDNGAARFDGIGFQTFQETVGQSITALLVAPDGNPYFASEQGQVFLLQQNKGINAVGKSIYGIHSMLAQPLISADADRPGLLPITSLAIMRGTLYAGSLSRGVFEIRTDGTAQEIVSEPRAYFVNALASNDETLWAGVKTGPAGHGFVNHTQPLQPVPVADNTGTINTLHPTKRDGAMWLGANGTGAWLCSDVATDDLQRPACRNFTFENTAGGLRSNRVRTVFVDREGVVWFGTERGVSRYDPFAARTEVVGDNADSNFIRTLYRTSDRRLYAGTNRGLYLSKDDTTWQLVESVGRWPIYALGEDAGGRVLVGTSNGLQTIAPNGAVSRPAFVNPEFATNNAVRAVTTWHGATWVAVYGIGLARLEGDRLTIVPTTVHPEIISLHADAVGRLWCGTGKDGVLQFDYDKGFLKVPALAGLAGRAVWSLDSLGEGGLFIGTERGLYYWRTTDDKPQVVVPEVDARQVRAVTQGGRRGAWGATAGAGLWRVAWDEIFGFVTTRFDAEQGWPAPNVFAVWADGRRDDSPASQNTVFAGTGRGLVRYAPGLVPPQLAPLSLSGRKLVPPMTELAPAVRVPYPQRSVALEFAAYATRTFPEQMQYGFVLRDAAGKIVQRRLGRDAQFTAENLRSGAYTLQAYAFTQDLTAARPYEVEIIVAAAPFPWFTVLLGVLLALALAALCWGYWQNRRLSLTGGELRATNLQLADARLRLTHEAETERRRIARDLHDQTLADLRRVALLTDELPAETLSDRATPARLRAEIEGVSQEIRRICEDLSPSVLENVGLAAALEFTLQQAIAQAAPANRFVYEFSCDDDLDERLSWTLDEQIQIYRIVQEAVANISRHARARRVAANVTLDAQDVFMFTLTDDGAGFAPETVQSGRGLANIRARADVVAASVAWHSTPDGTRFTLQKSPQE